MKKETYELMLDNPIIAAIKDKNGLQECCKSEQIKMVFVLFGDICNIATIVKELKEADKIVVVHVDLINGLSGKDIIIDFIKNNTLADGIISTKPALIKIAKEYELITVLRVFLLDSIAYESIQKQMRGIKPDMIEILPGLMPKVIKKVCKSGNVPIIAGGLISDKEDVVGALSAGAIAVSTTNKRVWEM